MFAALASPIWGNPPGVGTLTNLVLLEGGAVPPSLLDPERRVALLPTAQGGACLLDLAGVESGPAEEALALAIALDDPVAVRPSDVPRASARSCRSRAPFVHAPPEPVLDLSRVGLRPHTPNA
jgi:hypothetical protein